MKNLSLYVLSLILILSPVFSLPSALSAQPPSEKTKLEIEQELEPSQLGEEARQQIEAILHEKQTRTPEQRKIDSQLWQTIRQRQGQEAISGIPRVRTAVEVDAEGRALVEIRTHDLVRQDLVLLLEQIKGDVLYVSAAQKLIRARLPVDLLEAVAQRGEIRSIRRPAPILTNRRLVRQSASGAAWRETLDRKMARLRTDLTRLLSRSTTAGAESDIGTVAAEAIVTGPPITQGDKAHRANDVRETYGVDGTGVKVGVLSDSVRYLERSQANGNLPPDVKVLPGQSGITTEGLDFGEGTAMLELIHDIAPGAKLFFATGTSDIEGPEGMARNIRDLRFKYGCDIIVDDIGWGDQLPFQDFTLAQAVNDVTEDGALYFSSAGNAGNYNDGTSGTWQGDFKNAGRQPLSAGSTGDPLYTFHDFGGGLISNRISRTFGDGFAVIRLFWADPADAAQNDFDIYVLDSTLTRVRAFSIDDQSVFSFPGEGLVAFVNEGDRILIANYNGSQPRALYLDTFGSAELALTTGGYIAGQAAAANAFAVAAVPASVARNGVFVPGPTTPVEVFSADGPRHIFFNADGSPVTPGKYLFANGGVVRQKPDLAAADGVSTSLPQPFFSTFFGTSAAAPQAAAIAALLKSAVPALKPQEMREVLTSTALDIGPTGVDRVSGAGVVSALQAYLQAKPSPYLEFASADLATGPGDRDKSVEPGEEGLLQIAFVNNGTATATNIKATVTTSTPGVTMTVGESAYFQIPAGKGGVNLQHFRFHLAASAPCGVRPTFTVTVTSDQTLARSFNFNVQTGQPASTPAVLSLRNGNFSIQDGSITSLRLPITGFNAPITRFAFRFDGTDCASPTGVGLQHDRVSDLAITLTSPAGTTVTLLNSPGGLGLPSKNFCNTLLDDLAVTSIQNITSAGAPYTGAYRPFGRLSAFNGQSANGTWTLQITDRVPGATGTLRNFSFLVYTYSCDSGAAGVQEFRFSAD